MSENPAGTDKIETEIIDTILQAVNLQSLDRASLGTETPLTAGGLDLDSVDILEVVVAVEHRFGFKVGDPETGRTYFKTIGTIADLVRLKTAPSLNQ